MTMSVGRTRKNKTKPTTLAKISGPKVDSTKLAFERRRMVLEGRLVSTKLRPLIKRKSFPENRDQQQCRREKDARQSGGKRPVQKLGCLLADQRRHHQCLRATDERRRDIKA